MKVREAKDVLELLLYDYNKGDCYGCEITREQAEAIETILDYLEWD